MDALGIIIRWALFADLMLLFGVPLFSICSGAAATGSGALPLRRTVIVTAAAGIALSVVGVILLAAGMSGVPLASVALPAISIVVTATAAGAAFQARSGVLVLALFVGAGRRIGRVEATLVALFGAIALASLAWTGHGAMDSGAVGSVHLAGDILHLLTAGAWIGALASLLWLVMYRSDDSGTVPHRALAGFASAGSAIVALVVISALVNSWLVVGPRNLLSLGTSLYGQLLLLKLVMFAGMLSLAAINRFRLTPALGSATTQAGVAVAVQRLRLSLRLEILAAFAILGLVAWLGILEPPAALM